MTNILVASILYLFLILFQRKETGDPKSSGQVTKGKAAPSRLGQAESENFEERLLRGSSFTHHCFKITQFDECSFLCDFDKYVNNIYSFKNTSIVKYIALGRHNLKIISFFVKK